MVTLIQAPFVIVLFVTVRAADIAISAGIAHNVVRCIIYSIVAILAVFATAALLGVH